MTHKKPARQGLPWTKDDERVLKDDIQQGKSLSEIALNLGRTIGEVDRKAKELKIIITH